MQTIRQSGAMPAIDVFVAYRGGDPARRAALVFAEQFRSRGLATQVATRPQNLRDQLRTASQRGATYTVIIGENELENQSATVRDMLTGNQKQLPFSQVAGELLRECRASYDVQPRFTWSPPMTGWT